MASTSTGKRTMRPQWSDVEKEKMVSCIDGNPVLDDNLEGPNTRGHSNEQKVKAWKDLAEAVNVAGGHGRSWSECRAKKIKWFSKVKSKLAENRRHLLQTGNGGDPPHQLNALEERVGRLIPKIKIEGIPDAPKTKWPRVEDEANNSNYAGMLPMDLLGRLGREGVVNMEVKKEVGNEAGATPFNNVMPPALKPLTSDAGCQTDPGDVREQLSAMRQDMTRLVIAQEQQQSTMEMLSDIIGSISVSIGALNATLNPVDQNADTGPDFISMAIDIKENMYKHAFELDQSDLPIDESRQPLREVRVTR